jgi:uncharacterized membrane protein (DUF485 family)
VRATHATSPTVYESVQRSADFQELRSRLRRFVFPMSGAFLAWYLLYVLLASYAPALMAVKLVGNINVGLVIGLLQFVSTFVITTLYVRFAAQRLDPLAHDLRDRIEDALAREAAGDAGAPPADSWSGTGWEPPAQPGSLRAGAPPAGVPA